MDKNSTGNIGEGKKKHRKGPVDVMNREEFEALELDTRLSMIQSLIPLGLMYVNEELQKEVELLAGNRYARKDSDDSNTVYRYGKNPGSVKFFGQKVPIYVPRIRDASGEIRLNSYEELHRGREMDDVLFRRILYGISCRNYEMAAEEIPGGIGVSKSSVSRQFVETSAKELKALQERDLSTHDIIAVFIDGKTFAQDTMVVALGITMSGEKVVLGFVQAGTENKLVLSQFLHSLLDRGLNISKGILAIIDGGKGLHSAIEEVFEKRVVIQRCQWHKRENVVSYLPKDEQDSLRKRLQKAYERPTYEEALKKLNAIQKDLEKRNQSASESLKEGFEETMTLHRLGVFALIGLSFKTTNCIESINASIEERCKKIKSWKNSSQKQRWLAAALLDTEKRLIKVKGYKNLPKLREAIMKELNLNEKLKD